MLPIAHKLMITCAAALLVTSAQADIYKFTDAKGNVQYTDTPPTLPAERLNLQSQRTTVGAAQARPQDAEANLQTSREQRARQAEEKEALQLSAKDKAERCIKARERYDQYMTSQRLFRSLPDGEREYLSDAELAQARSTAKTTMDELCK